MFWRARAQYLKLDPRGFGHQGAAYNTVWDRKEGAERRRQAMHQPQSNLG